MKSSNQLLGYLASLALGHLTLTMNGQTPFIPKDQYDEPPSPAWTYLKNTGQVHDLGGTLRDDVYFHSVGTFPSIYGMKDNSISVCVAAPDIPTHAHDKINRIDLKFVGPNALNPEPYEWETVPQHYNFYEANTPDGITNVGGGKRVIYEGIYPDIDLHLYSNRWGPKLFLVVKPGGDPEDIKIEWSGHDALEVDLEGYLKVWFDTRYLKLTQGLAYQQDGEEIIDVPWTANYVISGDEIYTGFEFDDYDPALPLILVVRPLNPDQMPMGGDVPPEWCTFVAGTGDDVLHDVDTDEEGFVYFTGFSRSGANELPISPGAFDGENAGSGDAIVGRFNEFYEIDSEDAWMTYLGGSGPDAGTSLVYDDINERVTVVGYADNISTDLPNFEYPGNEVLNYQRAIDGTSTGFAAFFDPGLGTRIYLSRVPGDPHYFGGVDVDVDGNGNTYIVGSGVLIGVVGYEVSLSPSGAWHQTYFNEETIPIEQFYTEGYVLRLDPEATLTWFTRLGGTRDEFIEACKVDRLNNKLYIVGATYSPNDINEVFDCDPAARQFELPLCDAGGYFQTGCNGSLNTWSRRDGLIMRFEIGELPDLTWSTYFGGYWGETITDVAVDSEGRVYVAGTSETQYYNASVECAASNGEAGFPICTDDQYWDPIAEERRQFIARFEADTELSWSTKIGDNSSSISAGDCMLEVDASDNVYIVANTAAALTSYAVPITLDGESGYYYDDSHADIVLPQPGRFDGFVGLFSPVAQRLYASFFGGNGNDVITGIALTDERLYICGSTQSVLNFPTHAPSISGHTPYLNEVPNPSPNTSDGFIAQIRTTMPIGIVEGVDNGVTSLVLIPNPTVGELQVILPSTVVKGQILIHDLSGRLVASKVFQESTNPVVDTSHLSQGSYTVTLLTDALVNSSGRFCKL